MAAYDRGTCRTTHRGGTAAPRQSRGVRAEATPPGPKGLSRGGAVIPSNPARFVSSTTVRGDRPAVDPVSDVRARWPCTAGRPRAPAATVARAQHQPHWCMAEVARRAMDDARAENALTARFSAL